ncbi:MAG: hypothetical protein NZ520_08060, partial [bacterium]|nr:hypothetical protein [bacterium]
MKGMTGRVRGMTPGASAQRGQTLIVALVVLFVMMFMGALFVAIIGRNLENAVRSGRVTDVQYFAEAGIQYADQQLTYSEEGADWRPVPANLPPDQCRDPDYQWLRPFAPQESSTLSPCGTPVAGPSGGYSRVLFENGRALIRVSYNPRPYNPNDPESGPLSRFIKIESIGRAGRIDPGDPTMLTAAATGLRRELVAYKAIGITDYLRFVTNRDNRANAVVELGVPEGIVGHDVNGNPVPVRLVWGNGTSGAPIRINGSVKWYGGVQITLNPQQGDRIEVAGDILLAPRAQVTVNGNPLLPSASATFNTYGGIVRDGRTGVGVDGGGRSIARLEPPLIDLPDPATNVSRYWSMTRNSGALIGGRNSGLFGFGRGIYINNRADVLREPGLFGGPTVRSELLRQVDSRHWQGPYYVPPGAIIRLNPFGFTIQLTRGRWRAPNGAPTNAVTMVCAYLPDGRLSQDLLDPSLNKAAVGLPFVTPFSGVIYAEGNVRIRGIIPQGKQLTVVSGGNIFIEGNLMRLRLPNGQPDNTSAIALLAKENIVVNTTLFVDPELGTEAGGWNEQDAPLNFPSWHRALLPAQRQSFVFSSAVPLNSYLSNARPNGLTLLVRHAAIENTQTSILLRVNYPVNDTNGNGVLDEDLYRFPGGVLDSLGLPTIYLVNASGVNYEHLGLELLRNLSPLNNNLPTDPVNPRSDYVLNTAPGAENRLTFEVSSGVGNLPANEYHLSRVAVQPLDIAIEALMYAQEGSFIVIPGEWFNTDPRDTFPVGTSPSSVDQNLRRRLYGVQSPLYPFYAQPLDIRIVIRGAIAE